MIAKLEKVTFDSIRRSNPPYSSSRPPIPYTILLIEDESAMGQVTQLLLESCGYEVTVAADGAQGVRLAKALNPDLVICDVNMPGMSGLDVVQALCQSEVTRQIPVVFLSGYISDEQMRDAQRLGVRAFMGKPCSFEAMKQVITECRHAASGKTTGVNPPALMSLSA